MADDSTLLSFASGRALLDRLRLEPGAARLAVDLAVALGILIAEECPGDDMRLPLALANAISLAASARRRRGPMVSDGTPCAGSA